MQPTGTPAITDALSSDETLADWRQRSLRLEQEVSNVMLGQDAAIRLCLIAILCRGHVLLEGDVGVGKTTLLRCLARAVGGAYERVEGTIDLMPSDLIYYPYIAENGQPQVAPGPLLKHGENLASFFFNEINRARPQMHSLLLRVMAERSVTAFNTEHRFPHLQIFADRNRLEKEETYELPAAARDRFAMELSIEAPTDASMLDALMFDTRFHDPDALVESVPSAIVPYDRIGGLAARIQSQIQARPALRRYVLDLWRATVSPADYGIRLDDIIDMTELVQAGASPRGMSMLLRAARVAAWLAGRDSLIPEDVQAVFQPVVGHRIFFAPVYEFRRERIAGHFVQAILKNVACP